MFNRLKINRLSKKACEFLNNEDYDNASLLYDEILELDSNNINALYNKKLHPDIPAKIIKANVKTIIRIVFNNE